MPPRVSSVAARNEIADVFKKSLYQTTDGAKNNYQLIPRQKNSLGKSVVVERKSRMR